MNLLEQYLEPDYTVKILPKEKAPTRDTTWIAFDGKIDCYGNIRHVKRLFTQKEWQEAKKRGYYLA